MDDFSAVVKTHVRTRTPGLTGIETFGDLAETTRKVQPTEVEFQTSDSPRGLALKSIKLTKGFEGLMRDVFKKTNEVYFLSWAWDFNGKPPFEYPGAGAPKQQCIIPLKVGEVREFLGQGIALFPPRIVTAGLAVRIMLWESDGKSRDFGKAMTEVANSIASSKLTNLLSLISTGIGATVATIALVKDAALELSKIVGAILQANSDDYVDFYEGYYDASASWSKGDERGTGHASEIVLTRL